MDKPIVTQYAKMWPREVFDLRDGNRLHADLDLLKKRGVYVLYRDDKPYYIGKAGKMFGRIWAHANQPDDPYYNFWNFFSAFVVPDKSHVGEVESILIASTPTANRATPRIERLKMPAKLATLLKKRRLIQLEK